MTSPLTPDRDMILGHLGRLFGDQLEGLVEIAWTPVNSDQVTSANLYAVDRLEDLVDRAVKLNASEGTNVYIGAALRHPNTAPFGRTKDEDVFASTAYWADCDEPGCAEAVEQRSNGTPPNFAVVTGRKPHLREQFYWLTQEPIDLTTLRDQNDAIAAALQSDESVKNPGRIMRLAGSIAWPKKAGRVPELTEFIDYQRPPYANGTVARAFPKIAPAVAVGDSDLASSSIPAGQRQKTLTRLAGLLVKAFPFEQARLTLYNINEARCKDENGRPAPLPASDIDGMVRRIWEKEASKTTAVPCEINIEDWTVAKAYVGSPPEEEPVIGGVFMNKTAGVLAAIGGAGKTDVMLDAGIQVVTNEEGGNKWLGYPVEVFGSVVMLTAEDNAASVHQRLHKLAPMLDTSPVADKLVVVPIPNLPGASILIDKDAQPTDLLKRIGDQIDKLGDGRVFTPDPLRHFCRADINSDPEIATEVMNTFNTFATQHNLLVLMSHHLRKAGLLATTALEAREAIQGVGGIVDHARAAMAFWLPKKERAVDILRQLAMSDPNEPAYRVLFAALVKANHPRPNFATRTLVRTDSDRLLDFTGKLEGEHVEELSAEQYDGRLSDLLDSIRKRAETGRRFKNSTHLPDGILHKENLDKMKSPDGKRIGNRKDIGDMLDGLVLRGRIKFVTHGGGAQWIVPTE